MAEVLYRKTGASGSGYEYGEPKYTGSGRIDQSYGAFMGKPQGAHLGSQSSSPSKEDDGSDARDRSNNPYSFDPRTSSARAERMQTQGRMQDPDDPINK